MSPMRNPFLLAVQAVIVLSLSACSLWDPEYEASADEQLGALLDTLRASDSATDADVVEGARFGIERVATRFPGHVASQVAAGAIGFESGEPQRAQGFLDRALSLDPANVEARLLRVRIAVADGNLDFARSLLDDGLRIRPDAFALHESSAWIWQLMGRSDEALEALTRAESLEAPTWRIAFHRGLIEEERGEFAVAEVHYQRALDENSACEEARRRLVGLSSRAR